MPRGEAVWSTKQRVAVRAALRSDPRVDSLTLPKVFVYPFPSELVWSMPELLREAGAKRWNSSYWEFAFGRRRGRDGRLSTVNERWTSPDGERGARWHPSRHTIGEWVKATDKTKQTLCDQFVAGDFQEKLEEYCFVGIFDQHELGTAVHRSLDAAYGSHLVTDPAEADIFFIPDHIDTDALKKTGVDAAKWSSRANGAFFMESGFFLFFFFLFRERERVSLATCFKHRLVGPIWVRHLAKFTTGVKAGSEMQIVSYAERNAHADHFVVHGRARVTAALYSDENLNSRRLSVELLTQRDVYTMRV